MHLPKELEADFCSKSSALLPQLRTRSPKDFFVQVPPDTNSNLPSFDHRLQLDFSLTCTRSQKYSDTRSPPRREALLYKKYGRALRNFWKEPQKGNTKTLFCERRSVLQSTRNRSHSWPFKSYITHTTTQTSNVNHFGTWSLVSNPTECSWTLRPRTLSCWTSYAKHLQWQLPKLLKRNTQKGHGTARNQHHLYWSSYLSREFLF